LIVVSANLKFVRLSQLDDVPARAGETAIASKAAAHATGIAVMHKDAFAIDDIVTSLG
jgi:hypothetical protein